MRITPIIWDSKTLDLDFANVKFCLIFTVWGENGKRVNSSVTHNCALLRI